MCKWIELQELQKLPSPCHGTWRGISIRIALVLSMPPGTAGGHAEWWQPAEDGSAGAKLQVGSFPAASTRTAAQLHTCVRVCKHICRKINRLSWGLADSSELVFLEGSHTTMRAGCST